MSSLERHNAATPKGDSVPGSSSDRQQLTAGRGTMHRGLFPICLLRIGLVATSLPPPTPPRSGNFSGSVWHFHACWTRARVANGTMLEASEKCPNQLFLRPHPVTAAGGVGIWVCWLTKWGINLPRISTNTKTNSWVRPLLRFKGATVQSTHLSLRIIIRGLFASNCVGPVARVFRFRVSPADPPPAAVRVVAMWRSMHQKTMAGILAQWGPRYALYELRQAILHSISLPIIK